MNNAETRKKGFTLIEIVTVLAIVAILTVVAIPVFTGYVTKARQEVLNYNQSSLGTIVSIGDTLDQLPNINSGNATQNRNTIAQLIIEGNHSFINPITKSTDIISTTQAGSKTSAAIVIAQRNVSINTAVNNQITNLWPLNAAESSKLKFKGTLIIQICNDGYLIYSYPAYGVAQNIKQYPGLGY
ncbi:MAG: prepilin-type N-terminal cleavage/methylation domain-containing protein [Firmicutes bacterium]|nr:prepilin-type N-terminal cleavage/methylation domain-containing protein [Bacillota bacterium]